MIKSLLTVSIAITVLNGIQAGNVICYYPSYSAYDDITPENLDPTLCTHINYAFILLSEDGSLEVADEYLDIDQGLFTRVTNLKLANPSLKVLLSVGGGGQSDYFSEIAADESKRSTFVVSANHFLSEYNFDGLDVDWEYPEDADRENYITLLRQLKEAFEPKGWLLTAAVSSAVDEHGYNAPEMAQYLDFINLMTYDFYGPWSQYTGQNSALYASSVESQYEKANLNVEAAANKWVSAGVPKNRLALGMAFYGRSFTLSKSSDHGLHAGITGVGADGGEFAYSQICAEFNDWETVSDEEQHNPYKYKDNQWLGYDNLQSLTDKAQFTVTNGFFGAMIWSINQDDIFGECGQGNQTLLRKINSYINKVTIV
ncbi:hypothetical protein ABEB36_002157 [Hypothenemus hampei]|uniref:GH18 domain-containing protein n=1 Tax=Hypothenemus hampei TaxID=57062 RepID=A0ABD1F4R5_HYPHA